MMVREEITISDEIWKKFQKVLDKSCTEFPPDQKDRQKIVRGLVKFLIDEFDIDFGGPW